MGNLYWILEFAKVFAGYLFVMFIWPSVVFERFVRGKSTAYRFSFYVVVQVILINTVVLLMGLSHTLNKWTVNILFYGTFLFFVAKRFGLEFFKCRQIRKVVLGECGLKQYLLHKLQLILSWLKDRMRSLRLTIKPHLLEYILLTAVLIFGVIYFSYGAFQDHSYGFGDMYTHHAWIYGLTQGKAFSSGVYPEAMHCFVYLMHSVFGIRIFSCMLFLAGIHIITYLISVYLFLREIFHWHFTPFIVLGLFLTLNLQCIDEVFSMSRLQWTLPQEFGFYAQFLCALYLIRYLKSTVHHIKKSGEPARFIWNDDLFLFMMSLAATLVIHFYTTMMAFFLCVAIVVFMLRKLFTNGHFVPLVVSVLLGLVIAVLPMGIALATGTPFQGSINWAVNVMSGTDTKEGRAKTNTQADPVQTDSSDAAQDTEENNANPDSVKDGSAANTVSDSSNTSGISSLGTRIVRFIKDFYRNGYQTLYGGVQGRWIVILTCISVILYILFHVFAKLLRSKEPFASGKITTDWISNYPGILFGSVLFMFLYAAPLLGLPELIAGSRMCTTEHFLIISVLAIPFDVLFSLLSCLCQKAVMYTIAVAAVAATYFVPRATGCFHSFLYYELTRYNAIVDLTCEIVSEYDQYSYTIVAPTDELYSVIEYGRHEDLYNFINMSYTNSYTLPTEHVFVYIEKKPMQYAQNHFFGGPKWLAYENYPSLYTDQNAAYVSQCPEINASEISEEHADEAFVYSGNSWSLYTNLDNRTIMESRAYRWSQIFTKKYPYETTVYYEDDDVVCYYIHQNVESLFNMAVH